MSSSPAIRKELAKISLTALLALFLLPGLTLYFANHFKSASDVRYVEEINQSIRASENMTDADKQAAMEYFQAVQPSATCFNNTPDMAAYRADVCSDYSEMWQFVVVEKVAFWTVMAGVLLLVLMVALGALAFARRSVQYISFVFGWRVLVFASASEIMLQGLFAVWLSFWLTAFFMNIYVIKLIAIVGVVVAIGIFSAVVAIFRRVAENNIVQGEMVTPEVAPALWSRIREFADKLNTAPPTQIIAGIDANFFVTENSLKVGEQSTRGRSLYISIPLLRVLDQTEADAVLAHELGHFVGGDTANAAALGPKLVQYDFYSEQMRQGGVTIVAFFLLNLYRVIFEMALQKSSR
ncbi:MAG: M48 family metallopeptidase, partial [Methylococcales bacterium]